MEIVAFSILFFFGLITVFTESNSLLRWLYIPALFVFMIIVRLQAFFFGGFEIDIITYAGEMQGSLLLNNIYYLREFIFWFGIRLLYLITSSPFFTFIFLDFLWIYYLVKTTKFSSPYNLGRGLIIILATSFPFVFGYENIYRQFYATIILLYSYSMLDYNINRSYFLFFVSLFIHNLMIFALPLFLIRRCYKFKLSDRIIISLLISFIFIIILPFFLNLKGLDITKIDFSFLYFLLFLLLSLLYVYKFRDNIYSMVKYFPSLLPSLLLISGFMYIGEEMITERVSMILIIFFLYDIYYYSVSITNRTYRIIFRLGLLIIFTLPVYLFESSLKFLL